VLEKEWLCGPCIRTKQTVVEGAQDLVAAEDLTIYEVRPSDSIDFIVMQDLVY
jgi:hypothetical protein